MRSPLQSDFVLSNGAQVEIKAGKDVNGLPVVSSLEVRFIDRRGNLSKRGLPEGGITRKLLLEIDLEQAILDQIGKATLGVGLSSRERELLRDAVVTAFDRSGRTPVPESGYAALSALYVDALLHRPRNPILYLSEQFGIERSAMLGRLNKAKLRGLLTNQTSEGPSGRAGAEMSQPCIKLVSELLKGIE